MNIVAFAGTKQSGKTSSCVFIQQAFDTLPETQGLAKIYNFADPLKKMCIDIFGFERSQCYGTDEDKNRLVNCFWPSDTSTEKQMTAREVMQYVGTDIFRKIQTNVWSDATMRLIKSENPDLALIADCRFPNEVDAVKKAGGLVIKLNRSPYSSTHASETALDESVYDASNFDLIIDNSEMVVGVKNNIILNYLSDKGILSL